MKPIRRRASRTTRRTATPAPRADLDLECRCGRLVTGCSAGTSAVTCSRCVQQLVEAPVIRATRVVAPRHRVRDTRAAIDRDDAQLMQARADLAARRSAAAQKAIATRRARLAEGSAA